jgi:hypothetical protein
MLRWRPSPHEYPDFVKYPCRQPPPGCIPRFREPILPDSHKSSSDQSAAASIPAVAFRMGAGLIGLQRVAQLESQLRAALEGKGAAEAIMSEYSRRQPRVLRDVGWPL